MCPRFLFVLEPIKFLSLSQSPATAKDIHLTPKEVFFDLLLRANIGHIELKQKIQSNQPTPPPHFCHKSSNWLILLHLPKAATVVNPAPLGLTPAFAQ